MKKTATILLIFMSLSMISLMAQDVRVYPFSIKLPSFVYNSRGEGTGVAHGYSAGLEFVHNNIGYSVDVNYNYKFFAKKDHHWAVMPSIRRYLDQRQRYFVGGGAGVIFGHLYYDWYQDTPAEDYVAGKFYIETGIKFPILKRTNRVNVGLELGLRDNIIVFGHGSSNTAILNCNSGLNLLTKLILMF